MRILIVGEGKSGTTALLRSVVAGLGEPPEVFEPADLTDVDLRPKSLVVKKLLASWREPESSVLDAFDKRILLVRDPRDRLVSHLLYDAYNQRETLSTEQRDRWLRILGLKQENPAGIPFVKLIDVWWQITGVDLLSGLVRSNQRINTFFNQNREGTLVFKYEDYVDGNFGSLDEHLGVSIEAGKVRTNEARVARRGHYGDWRDWFNGTDVTVFRAMTSAFLKRYGYDARDWDISESPHIEPETGREYVSRLLETPVP
ncbi:MAG: hypothetical protein ACR2P0_15475 [Acidimicrobiales bacterium]